MRELPRCRKWYIQFWICNDACKKSTEFEFVFFQMWDEDLAYVAGFNARQCLVKHDMCRKTRTYPHSGQNIGWSFKTSGYDNIRLFLRSHIANWFNEHANTNMTMIRLWKPLGGLDYGHFTSMMQDRSSHVGCAMVQYRDGNKYDSLMTCNYEFNNIATMAVYKAGATCSGCKTTCTKNPPGLCGHNAKSVSS